MYSQIPTSGAGDFTVTRATVATRVGPDGLIASVASGIPRLDYFASGGVVGCPALLVEPSGSNGILNSTDTTTNWSLGGNLSGTAIDAIGVSGRNITVVSGGSGIGSGAGRYVRFSNNVALASGSTYTLSFLMKKTGAHTIGGFQLIMSSGAIGSGFDVSGSFTSGSNVNTAPTTNRIRRVEQFGTDVYRCSETFTMTAAATGTHLAFGPVSAVTVDTNSAVGTSMGFAAPQLELGSVPTSFIPTTTAAVTRNADAISVSGAVSGAIGQTEGTIYAEFNMQTLGVEGYAIRLVAASFDNSVHIVRSSANLVSLVVRAGGSNVFSQAVAATGFVKAAVAYKSGDIAAFVNGTQVGTTSTSSLTFGASFTAVNLGAFSSGAAVLNDRIRAVALYTTRLTDEQLASLTT